MQIRQTMSAALLCLGLVLLCGCPPVGNGGPSGNGSNGAGGSVATTTEPGMDFHRKNVGMPITTLDYIGDAPLGLAGARGTGQVFFAVKGQGDDELYVRDPATMERRFLGQVPQLQQGSLAASVDGKYLVYCRQRDREKYIDNPKITYPKQVAVVTRFETDTGKEEILFDFKSDPFVTFRNNQLTPMLSRDGSVVAAISYNMDRLTTARMLGDWLALEADLRERNLEMPQEERQQVEESLQQLLAAPKFRDYLSEKGVTLSVEGAPSEAERDALEEFYVSQRGVEAVLLHWENGSSRLLKLAIPEKYENSLVFLAAVDKDVVLIWPQPLVPDPSVPNEFYMVDLETGGLELACSFMGTPSTFELSQDAGTLYVVYNPVDVDAMEITTETKLLSCPLAGGEPVETSMMGDYLGFVDLVQDGRFTVGQDQDNHNIVLCDTSNQQESVQLFLPSAISGIFLDQQLNHAVFLDAGVLYAIPLSQEPEQNEGYIDAGYFEQFQPKFTDFLESLGMTGLAGADGQFEERWGLKTHEVSAQLANPEQPGQMALIRYSLTDNRVVAAWFPAGYPFPTEVNSLNGELDYYEAKSHAEKVLDDLGWLNPETRTVYQPGANPLYDGRTHTYILLYRDGYWLDESAKDKWIVNQEATLRVNSQTGEIAELSISHSEPIFDQPFAISLEQSLYYIRNEGEVPIPEDAPIRFDLDNVRYVIDMADETLYGPAEYTLGNQQRICYEIDSYITPEDELIATFRVDTETGAILGQLDFQPSSLAGLQGTGAQ